MACQPKGDPSPLLTLPRELRDEIFAHMALPQHVYTSSVTPDTRSLHRSNKIWPTYVDTRIYLPVRPPTNILATCRQLREECLQLYASLFNSLLPATITDMRPAEETASNKLAARINASSEELAERAHDDDSVRITLEIQRAIRGTMGYHVPKREDLSPRFMALLPLLRRLKKLKLTVWAGYSWWEGPVERRFIGIEVRPTARFKRTSPDQDDKLQEPTQWKEEAACYSKPDNALSTAIDAILKNLPLIEEVNVDILMHVSDYFNWDLPDVKWEGVQSWLDGPVCSNTGDGLKRVYRRFVVLDPGPPTKSATFLRQLESRQKGKDYFRVDRGTGEVSL